MFPVSLAPCLGIAAKMKVPNKNVPLAGHFRFSTPHPNHLRRPAHWRYANEANNSITVPIGVRRTAQQWGCPAAARPSQPSLIISTHHSILTCIPECHGSERAKCSDSGLPHRRSVYTRMWLRERRRKSCGAAVVKTKSVLLQVKARPSSRRRENFDNYSRNARILLHITLKGEDHRV
jgi:hypothetical protein